MVEFILAVDGGGSGTRVLLTDASGKPLARAHAGPSALSQGVAAAWVQVQLALYKAFAEIGITAPDWTRCIFSAGLSGVHNPTQAAAFRAELPAFARVHLHTDGYTMLVGAHQGQPGVLVAAGTGSVGEVLRRDGSHAIVGGWGFPIGDEGSGAWLGLQAMRIAHCALDGRLPHSELAQRVWQHCGTTRHDLLAWCASANQFRYGELAPLVFASEANDPAADKLLTQAAHHLETIAHALDPQAELPVAICGSIGKLLQKRLNPNLQERCVEPALDALGGAVWLAT